MSDVEFNFYGVPNRYQDVVQRLAVLYPLRGILTGNEQIRTETKNLLDQWRARVGRLTAAGWEPHDSTTARHSILYARNCKPTFVMTDRRTRSCKLNTLCPFCYARWVRDVWYAIDEDMPAPDPPPEQVDATTEHGRELRSIILDGVEEPARRQSVFRFHLVERHHTFFRDVMPLDNPQGLTLGQNMAGLLENITAQRATAVDMVDPVGAFLYTTVEPWENGSQWRIHYRQLFKLTPEQQFPQEITDNTNGRVTRHERPTRREIMKAVGRVCRYPTELITGDAERVVQLMTVRRSVRFKGSARFRSFRNTKTYEE